MLACFIHTCPPRVELTSCRFSAVEENGALPLWKATAYSSTAVWWSRNISLFLLTAAMVSSTTTTLSGSKGCLQNSRDEDPSNHCGQDVFGFFLISLSSQLMFLTSLTAFLTSCSLRIGSWFLVPAVSFNKGQVVLVSLKCVYVCVQVCEKEREGRQTQLMFPLNPFIIPLPFRGGRHTSTVSRTPSSASCFPTSCPPTGHIASLTFLRGLLPGRPDLSILPSM